MSICPTNSSFHALPAKSQILFQQNNNITQNRLVYLKLELSSAPMPTFRVVTDLVAGLHSVPLRQWAILLCRFCEFPLDNERLMSSHER